MIREVPLRAAKREKEARKNKKTIASRKSGCLLGIDIGEFNTTVTSELFSEATTESGDTLRWPRTGASRNRSGGLCIVCCAVTNGLLSKNSRCWTAAYAVFVRKIQRKVNVGEKIQHAKLKTHSGAKKPSK
jgi:hypothetical protein